MGSIQRNSGFLMNNAIVMIGNQNTQALCDTKSVMYAINLPILLASVKKIPSEEIFGLLVDYSVQNKS